MSGIPPFCRFQESLLFVDRIAGIYEGTHKIRQVWEKPFCLGIRPRKRSVTEDREKDRPQKDEVDRLPLAMKIQKMTVPERIKLAQTGGQEARALLMQDPNRVVQLAVLENPKITSSEVVGFANSRNISDEALRKIADNREWFKLYPVRLALVKNPKTPVGIALKLVATLNPQDLKLLAKSKSVSSVIVQAARRQLERAPR